MNKGTLMNKGSKKIEGLALNYIEGLAQTEVLQQANLKRALLKKHRGHS